MPQVQNYSYYLLKIYSANSNSSFSLNKESRRVDFLICFYRPQTYLVGFSPSKFVLANISFFNLSFMFLILSIISGIRTWVINVSLQVLNRTSNFRNKWYFFSSYGPYIKLCSLLPLQESDLKVKLGIFFSHKCSRCYPEPHLYRTFNRILHN